MTQEWITPIPTAVFFTKGVGKHKYRPQSLELRFGFEDDPNRSYDFTIKRTVADYQPGALRSLGTR